MLSVILDEKNFVCLEVSELFTLAEYVKPGELLLWNQSDSKGSQTSLTVEQIVQHRLAILTVEIYNNFRLSGIL